MRRSLAAAGPSAGRSTVLASLALAAAVAAAAPATANAQGWLDRAKQRAKERVDRQVDKQVDRALDGTVDSTAARVTGQGGAPAVPAANRSGGAPASAAAGDAVDGAAGDGAAGEGAAFAGGGAAFVNYDFKPGETPIFVDDFARDQVGDFPRRLEFKQGNAEVAAWNGGRWLRTTSPSRWLVPLPAALPQRFTVEMDFVPGREGHHAVVMLGTEGPGGGLDVSSYQETHIEVRHHYDNVELKVVGGGVEARTMSKGVYKGRRPFTLRLMVDGSYLKAYVDGERLANVPNAKLRRGNRLVVDQPGDQEQPGFAANVRVYAGGRKLYDALAEKGRVSTQGILFATGSDQIRPESKPTLDEIGTMLKEHPDLRLAINGHTDNVGQAAANQTLSEKRAAAVMQALVAQYGVDAARLASKGFGATKPATGNDTPEGRQQNRRVELVKM